MGSLHQVHCAATRLRRQLPYLPKASRTHFTPTLRNFLLILTANDSVHGVRNLEPGPDGNFGTFRV